MKLRTFHWAFFFQTHATAQTPGAGMRLTNTKSLCFL